MHLCRNGSNSQRGGGCVTAAAVRSHGDPAPSHVAQLDRLRVTAANAGRYYRYGPAAANFATRRVAAASASSLSSPS